MPEDTEPVERLDTSWARAWEIRRGTWVSNEGYEAEDVFLIDMYLDEPTLVSMLITRDSLENLRDGINHMLGLD